MAMHVSRLFFKISDIANHPLRNYLRYPNVKRELNIPFDTRFGNKTSLDIYYPAQRQGKLPVIVNVHGGGFVCGDKRYRSGIARLFASHGWAVINVNYRLAPKHPFPAATEDVLCALNYVNTMDDQYGLDLDKILVTGDSAGGYYAAHAVAAAVNPDLRARLSLPEYTGKKIRALFTFCAPFDLIKCFTTKTPLNVTVDVTNCVFGTSYKNNSVDPNMKYLYESNILHFINKDFPECFIVAAEHDSFCGGQIDGILAKLKEFDIPAGEYRAAEKGDGHCTHLLPFKKGTKPCLDAVVKFFESVKRS